MERITSCHYCNSTFIPAKTKPDQKFCSKRCRERSWVETNREKLNENVRNYRKRRYEQEGRWRDESPKAKSLKEWYKELKSLPCQDCGNCFPECCMDFDHRDGEQKTYNVGSMFAHHYSKELIQLELDKCDLVCANCHRIRTRNRRIGSGKSRISGIPENS